MQPHAQTSQSTPVFRAPLWPALWRAVRDGFLAIAIYWGVSAVAGFLVPPPGQRVAHSDRYSMRSFPQDAALDVWGRRQPWVDQWDSRRSGNAAILEYRLPENAPPLAPPWKSLGYAQPFAAQRSAKPLARLKRSKTPAGFFVMTCFGMAAMLAFGRWRLKEIYPSGGYNPYALTCGAVIFGFINVLFAGFLMGDATWLAGLFFHLTPRNELYNLELSFPMWARWGMACVGATLVPVTEETVWRGVVFGRLDNVGYPWVGAIVSAALFAAYHRDAGAFPALFAFGLLMAWLYRSNGTLAAPIIAHGGLNFLIMASTAVRHPYP